MDRGLTVHASRMHKKELRNANKEFNCNNCSLKCSAKNDMYKYKKEDHITKRKKEMKIRINVVFAVHILK